MDGATATQNPLHQRTPTGPSAATGPLPSSGSKAATNQRTTRWIAGSVTAIVALAVIILIAVVAGKPKSEPAYSRGDASATVQMQFTLGSSSSLPASAAQSPLASRWAAALAEGSHLPGAAVDCAEPGEQQRLAGQRQARITIVCNLFLTDAATAAVLQREQLDSSMTATEHLQSFGAASLAALVAANMREEARAIAGDAASSLVSEVLNLEERQPGTTPTPTATPSTTASVSTTPSATPSTSPSDSPTPSPTPSITPSPTALPTGQRPPVDLHPGSMGAQVSALTELNGDLYMTARVGPGDFNPIQIWRLRQGATALDLGTVPGWTTPTDPETVGSLELLGILDERWLAYSEHTPTNQYYLGLFDTHLDTYSRVDCPCLIDSMAFTVLTDELIHGQRMSWSGEVCTVLVNATDSTCWLAEDTDPAWATKALSPLVSRTVRDSSAVASVVAAAGAEGEPYVVTQYEIAASGAIVANHTLGTFADGFTAEGMVGAGAGGVVLTWRTGGPKSATLRQYDLASGSSLDAPDEFDLATHAIVCGTDVYYLKLANPPGWDDDRLFDATRTLYRWSTASNAVAAVAGGGGWVVTQCPMTVGSLTVAAVNMNPGVFLPKDEAPAVVTMNVDGTAITGHLAGVRWPLAQLQPEGALFGAAAVPQMGDTLVRIDAGVGTVEAVVDVNPFPAHGHPRDIQRCGERYLVMVAGGQLWQYDTLYWSMQSVDVPPPNGDISYEIDPWVKVLGGRGYLGSSGKFSAFSCGNLTSLTTLATSGPWNAFTDVVQLGDLVYILKSGEESSSYILSYDPSSGEVKSALHTLKGTSGWNAVRRPRLAVVDGFILLTTYSWGNSLLRVFDPAAPAGTTQVATITGIGDHAELMLTTGDSLLVSGPDDKVKLVRRTNGTWVATELLGGPSVDTFSHSRAELLLGATLGTNFYACLGAIDFYEVNCDLYMVNTTASEPVLELLSAAERVGAVRAIPERSAVTWTTSAAGPAVSVYFEASGEIVNASEGMVSASSLSFLPPNQLAVGGVRAGVDIGNELHFLDLSNVTALV